MLEKLKFRSVSTSRFSEIPSDFFPGTSCRACLYWIEESGVKPTSPEVEKRRWLARVNKSFGECIKTAHLGEEVAAWALYSPPRFLPTVSSYPVKPSNDAVFIACLAVSPRHRGRGVGSAVLREILTSLDSRGLSKVETIARRGSTNNPSGPIELYLKNGFKVWQDHDEYPLLRLETAQRRSIRNT